MAGCRIVNQNVADAVSAIADIAKEYETAGDNFVTALNTAISEMEGATKDAIKQRIDTDVKSYVYEQLPSYIRAMSERLEGNRSNFESYDAQLANGISGS
jgi:membrane-bound lytic murein transglycosylase MltF